MQKQNDKYCQKPISMEEYLYKRQKIREEEQTRRRQEKSPAYMLAGLYV